MKETPFNKGETKQQKETEDTNRAKYQQLLMDIKTTFSTEHGLRVLNFLLGLCQVGRSIFTGNSTTFYNAGQQDIGQDIIDIILEAEPEIYAALLRKRANELRVIEVQTKMKHYNYADPTAP
jgi:hypothetical protein